MDNDLREKHQQWTNHELLQKGKQILEWKNHEEPKFS